MTVQSGYWAGRGKSPLSLAYHAKEPPRQEVIGLTAHNRPDGFSPVERGCITAGDWDALLAARVAHRQAIRGHHSRRPLDTDLARGENHGGIRD